MNKNKVKRMKTVNEYCKEKNLSKMELHRLLKLSIKRSNDNIKYYQSINDGFYVEFESEAIYGLINDEYYYIHFCKTLLSNKDKTHNEPINIELLESLIYEQ